MSDEVIYRKTAPMCPTKWKFSAYADYRTFSLGLELERWGASLHLGFWSLALDRVANFDPTEWGKFDAELRGSQGEKAAP